MMKEDACFSLLPCQWVACHSEHIGFSEVARLIGIVEARYNLSKSISGRRGWRRQIFSTVSWVTYYSNANYEALGLRSSLPWRNSYLTSTYISAPPNSCLLREA
jgi:hypothetical protein